MISASGLTRTFGARAAVRDVSFQVAPGEVVGLLGPNGAGKTTTMRMILGLLRPSAGTARVESRVGYLPEQFAAYDALHVMSYLTYLARMKRLPPTAAPAALAAAAAEELAGRPVGRLSKGQRQRIGLAQAVLGEPGALVLDEPTIGLDPAQVVDARRLITSCARAGAAVLVSTHLLAEAAAICDRVVVIAGGQVVAEERPGDAPDLEMRYLRLVADAQPPSS